MFYKAARFERDLAWLYKVCIKIKNARQRQGKPGQKDYLGAFSIFFCFAFAAGRILEGI